MKILVTGAAGFIGFFLAKKLLLRGDIVVGIDNLNEYYDVNIKLGRLKELGVDLVDSDITEPVGSTKFSNFTFQKLDISDKNSLDALFESEKFDAVCNLAAQAGVRYSIQNPHAYIQSNVVGFLNILESCRHNGVNNLSFASSSSVYGLNRSQPFCTTDHTDHPISLYAATKKSNEMMAHSYAHLYNIQISGIRFFTVYGPWGRPDMAPMLFADAILHNRAIKVFNGGDMSRDFTFVEDIVDGLVRVIDNPASPDSSWSATNPKPDSSSAPYRLYNIGNNSSVNLLDFIKTMQKHLNKEAKKEMLPMQDGDVKSTLADVSTLIKDFGYQPSTTVDDGVKIFVEWYREFYGLKD